jgi:hypothetical protein
VLAVASGPEAGAAFSPPPLVEAENVREAEPQVLRLGVLVDVGIPDGAGASLVVKPTTWLRVQAGAIGNGIGAGVRAGLVLSPLDWPVRPTLSVEAGHYFDGDASWLLGDASSAALKSFLSRVSYDFAEGHLGLEFGSKRFAFFLRAGLAYVDVSVPNPTQLLSNQAADGTGQAAHIRSPLPSAKLGFVLFIL